jgi:PKD domain
MRRNQLIARRSRWAALAITLTSFAGLFVVTSGAQAVVVNDHGTIAGVAMVPQLVNGVLVPGNETQNLSNAGVSPVTSGGPCTDPWLSSDFVLSSGGLCWHTGGSVVHENETFALTWDAPTANSQHNYWSGTRGYVEQFLRDVSSASGALGDPYAVTSQYQDGSGRAGNTSTFGGGCVDLGSVGGSDCEYGSPTVAGHDYPANGCTPTGSSQLGLGESTNNSVCLTDSQLQGEIAAMVTQTGIEGRTEPGHTPLVVLLTPPGVETCIDAGGALCSVNSNATAQFCSYHSEVNVNGAEVPYVVQPWTPFTYCDDPSDPALDPPVTPQQLSANAGLRIVDPLSQGEIAAITNPGLNGWFALDGSEINDNGGCVSEGANVDQVTVGDSSQNPYLLQHEYNNGAAIEADPFTYFGCAPGVILSPSFVVPSAVNQGDVVALDGSSTGSTLLVPNAGYQWSFGDGTQATGPSVEHSYAKGGTYTVTLTVTDRGGNQESLSQTIVVLGANGQPVPAGTNGGQEGGAGNGAAGPLQVRIQLMPQSLSQVLGSGIEVRVTANERADGFAYVSVPRALAKRMHLKAGRRLEVLIGAGTVSNVGKGTVLLHLHLSRAMVKRLKRLNRVTFKVSLQLIGAAGDHLTADAAGRY